MLAAADKRGLTGSDKQKSLAYLPGAIPESPSAMIRAHPQQKSCPKKLLERSTAS